MLIIAEKYHRNRFSNTAHIYEVRGTLGLLPNTSNCGCVCAGNTGNVFPVTAGKQSRHASRHVRNAAAGEIVPGIPGACATRSFTYLVRFPGNHNFKPHKTSRRNLPKYRSNSGFKHWYWIWSWFSLPQPCNHYCDNAGYNIKIQFTGESVKINYSNHFRSASLHTTVRHGMAGMTWN